MAKKSTNKPNPAAMPAGEDNWRAQDALRTLTRAKEIERDRELMRAVKQEAKKQAKALDSVCSTPRKRK